MNNIKDYEIFRHRTLGKGAYSSVYLGKNTKTKQLVAIKIINIDKKKEKIKDRIIEEMNIMTKIKKTPHKNIVSCYDVIKNDNHIYIIMEYCNSGDLSQLLSKPIKEKYVQFYFNQLNEGIKYLRNNNIFHRDIKPKNILLTDNYKNLKIADFGLSKEIEHNSMINTVCGSPLYMAPEIMGKQAYTNQTDLWSIGLILYEMLFGKHPYYNCKDISSLMDEIKNNEIKIPPDNNINSNVSEECIELLEKLLKKNANSRITWDEFCKNKWINNNKIVLSNKVFLKNDKIKNCNKDCKSDNKDTNNISISKSYDMMFNMDMDMN